MTKVGFSSKRPGDERVGPDRENREAGPFTVVTQTIILELELGISAHAFNANTREAETGDSSRPAWYTQTDTESSRPTRAT